MTMHRIYCDLIDGTITARSTEVFELDGQAFYREASGCLRPVATDTLFSGQRYVATGWHASQTAAYSEAADELSRRAQAVALLHLNCRAAAEVVHV